MNGGSLTAGPDDARASNGPRRELAKAPTGISGLDEVLNGGLPKGRPSLVCGGAGCGKTLFSMQFLVRGALQFDEPGVFIAFEERPTDLAENVASLGIDLEDLQKKNLIYVDHIHVDPQSILENGEYDLEGLFLRIGLAIDTVGAKRIVIDTLEMLFGGLENYGVVRAELRRLFDWLKERGVTAIITAERGDGRLTRHGLEEYVSDCVIVLDHRIDDQVSTRRLRVAKYRGSTHGTNEYPFLIDQDGISVLPISTTGLNHKVSEERVSSGVPRLDAMLGGGGYYRGSTVLISGTAGVGKSTLGAHFADGSCKRGERVLYFSFEEAAEQIIRNMGSIGIDLATHQKNGLLRFSTTRPTAYGLETHLAVIHRLMREFKPHAVVLDPVSTFLDAGDRTAAHQMLVRLIDYLKNEGITAVLMNLTEGGAALEATDASISSIVDTWILVKAIETAGERNRGLYILKSRGMAHSNQVREFVIGAGGVDLLDVYVGPEGVLTGSARVAQFSREDEAKRARQAELAHAQRLLERRKALHREQLARMDAELAADIAELERKIATGERDVVVRDRLRDDMARARFADASTNGAENGA